MSVANCPAFPSPVPVSKRTQRQPGLAQSAGMPASTLVRTWITQRIAAARSTSAAIDPAMREAIRAEVEAAVKAAFAAQPHDKKSAKYKTG